MNYLKMLLAGALIVGMNTQAANAAPDNLRKSTTPHQGFIGKKGGKIGVPIVRPVGKYFYENNPYYGKYYRTQQYRMKHHDGDGNVD